MSAIDLEILPQLAALVARRLGLDTNETNRERLLDAARIRIESTGMASASAYLALLGTSDVESLELADALAVGETYFYRGADHFRAFVERVLPERQRACAGERPLRFLSAGCASGEEPYTLAMLLRDRPTDASIDAIDASRTLLGKAARGRYTAWSLRQTPPDSQSRWFRRVGNEWELDSELRRAVRFERANLIDAAAPCWRVGGYDAVFCRNVLIYLTPEAMGALVERIASVLAPGGFLFLSHTETLRGITTSFHLCHTHDTFYYQLRGAGDATASFHHDDAEPPALPLSEDASWVDEIQKSADRIAALSARRTVNVPPTAEPGALLARALERVRRDDHVGASELLETLRGSGDADAMLVLAAALVNRGRVAEAERALDEVLAHDELRAGAHYLLAVCREHAGQTDAAMRAAETAAYLDPSFAMPHLLLGRIARRRRDAERARRAFTQAIALLAREDELRVLLFGGGFGREALAHVCRAELAALGSDR